MEEGKRDIDWERIAEAARVSVEKLTPEDDPLLAYKLQQSLGEMDFFHNRLQNEHASLQRELDKSESKNKLLESFFDSAPIGYIVLTQKGTIDDANYSAAEYWGIPRHRLRGLGLFGLISEEYISVFIRALHSAWHRGKKKTIEVQCIRPGGKLFWSRFDISATQDLRDGEKKILCSIIDTTSDRMVENAIKKIAVGLSASTGQSFFRKIGEFLVGHPNVDYVVVSQLVDSKQGEFKTLSARTKNGFEPNFCYTIPQFATLLRDGSGHIYESRSLVCEPLASKWHTHDFLSTFLHDDNGNINGQIVVLSETNLAKKKLYTSILKIVSSRISAELDRLRAEQELEDYKNRLVELVEKRTAALKLKNDQLFKEIEKRKQIEVNLRYAKQEAEAAARTKSAFLANMSHEIRTPMNGIVGVASMLDQTDPTQKQRKYIKIIKSSSNALLRIINDILDISKLESGKVALESDEFNLRNFLYDILAAYESKAIEKGIRVYCDYDLTSPTYIFSDSVRLRQIVENLFTNAIKFTETGYVKVSVNFKHFGGKNYLRIGVTDSGIGLTQEKQGIIFDRFSQGDDSTTRKYGGTGLGLAISERLVGLFNGRIGVESLEGKGSSFYFTIPVMLAKKITQPVPKEGKFLVWLNFSDPILSSAFERQLAKHKIPVVGGTAKTSAGYRFREKNSKREMIVISDDRFLCDFEEWSRENSVLKKHTQLVRVGKSRQKLDSDFKAVKVIKDGAFCVQITLEYLIGLDNKEPPLEYESTKDMKLPEFKVLLAEDNDINRLLISEMLKEMGATVSIAKDGSEAVDLHKREHFDVILMDCLMPVMDGYEAVKCIKDLQSGWLPPIVALTANAMKGDRERCLSEGFDDYLAKPVQIEELREKLVELITLWPKSGQNAEG